MARQGVEVVLKLAERGWRLFPVEGTGKRKSPLIADWPNLASNQEEQIRSWVRRWPSCNWAVATGNGSGVFVMDFDSEDGLAVLRRWKAHHGDGTITRTSCASFTSRRRLATTSDSISFLWG